MRTAVILMFVFLVLVSGCTQPEVETPFPKDTAVPITTEPDNGDYFDIVIEYQKGRVCRFNKSPINVYIDFGDLDDTYIGVYRNSTGHDYKQDVYSAFNIWEEKSEGVITFDYVQNPDSADIILKLLDSSIYNNPKTYGTTDVCFTKTGEYYSLISINLYKRDESTGDAYITTSKLFLGVLMEEVGHALGLSGHSENPNDVMSMGAGNATLSSRDINTLKKWYTTPPKGISESEFIEIGRFKENFGKIIFYPIGSPKEKFMDLKNFTFPTGVKIGYYMGYPYEGVEKRRELGTKLNVEVGNIYDLETETLVHRTVLSHTTGFICIPDIVDFNGEIPKLPQGKYVLRLLLKDVLTEENHMYEGNFTLE